MVLFLLRFSIDCPIRFIQVLVILSSDIHQHLANETEYVSLWSCFWGLLESMVDRLDKISGRCMGGVPQDLADQSLAGAAQAGWIVFIQTHLYQCAESLGIESSG